MHLKRFLIVFLLCSISAGCRSWTKRTFKGNLNRQEVHSDGSRILRIQSPEATMNFYSCPLSKSDVKTLGEKELNHGVFFVLEGFSEQVGDNLDDNEYKLYNCKVLTVANKYNKFCSSKFPDGDSNIYLARCCDVNPDMTPKKKSTCHRA